MSKADLLRFIQKVEQLQDLVASLDEIPSRRDRLSSCDTHDEVVEIARSWGFEIGRRWGEPS